MQSSMANLQAPQLFLSCKYVFVTSTIYHVGVRSCICMLWFKIIHFIHTHRAGQIKNLEFVQPTTAQVVRPAAFESSDDDKDSYQKQKSASARRKPANVVKAFTTYTQEQYPKSDNKFVKQRRRSNSCKLYRHIYILWYMNWLRFGWVASMRSSCE